MRADLVNERSDQVSMEQNQLNRDRYRGGNRKHQGKEEEGHGAAGWVD